MKKEATKVTDEELYEKLMEELMERAKAIFKQKLEEKRIEYDFMKRLEKLGFVQIRIPEEIVPPKDK